MADRAEVVVTGLIGSGFMGKTHALALANVNRVFDLPIEVQLHTLADVNVELAKSRKTTGICKCYRQLAYTDLKPGYQSHRHHNAKPVSQGNGARRH